VFELSHRFKLCAPKVVITGPDHVANVQAACKENPDLAVKIFVLDEAAENALANPVDVETAPNGLNESTTDAAPSVTALLNQGNSDWFRITDVKTAKETIACMFSTSGTTGLPKVSQLSHHALVAQNISVQSVGKNYPVRHLISLPFFNMFASGIVHIDPIRKGEPVYVLSKFDIKKYVSGIQKYRITDTATAPLMIVYLLKLGGPLKEMLSSLRYIWNGSAPIDAATLNAFYDVLSPEAMIAGIWGMSETGAHTAFKWFERDTTGSVGRVVPGAEMKLLDEQGKEITADNTPGEAWIRSPQLMTSYINNPAATSDIKPADWLRTGDVCYVSAGKWYVVDRKKELIKVRGWQVAPAELEGVLVSHPKILDAAVVGVKLGDSEAPRAFIMRRPGVGDSDGEGDGTGEGGLGEAQVKRFMGERLAKFKSLEGGIVFVDGIPKNATGKTVKKMLVEKYPFSG
jgi:acyl-CoA synthetase (AMP-forming)/AMP-acid ligase II